MEVFSTLYQIYIGTAFLSTMKMHETNFPRSILDLTSSWLIRENFKIANL